MILPMGGVALLLVLATDVFSTVFHPRGRPGPLNRRQNRMIWALFRRLGRVSDRARDRWLGMAGPAMVVATVAVWVLLLVVGFALVYYPWIESFLVSPGSLRSPVVEVLYYSGYTAATLGFGDVVPDSDALRVLAPVEALGGFALLSSSVSYVLAVYRELIRKQALATRIDSFFRGDPGSDTAGRSPEDGRGAGFAGSVSAGLAEVLLAHHQYPVLHYFRSSNRWRSLPVQLGQVLELRRRAEASDSPGSAPAADHPLSLEMQNSLARYLQEVHALFTSGDIETGEPPGDLDSLERVHRRLLDYLEYR